MTPAPGSPIRDLPEFTNPPVSEVALSMAFEPLAGYTTVHAGVFWATLRDRFPRVEEHQPFEIPNEVAAVQPETNQPKIEMLDKFPGPRVWLLTEDQNDLIQVQRDGFFRNWRQITGDESYPRYARLRGSFEKDFRSFEAFAKLAKLGPAVPTRCEVTYVNHIPATVGWSNFGEIHNIISSCVPLRPKAFLPSPEECRYASKFPIKDSESGQFLGRLTVSIEPAFRKRDKQPLFAMTLTARGNPLGLGLEGVLAFFDVAHEWIVQGFADLTTVAMHEAWGRKR